ncbi:MAG: lipopolysaccharide biosynthesis protein [Fidelibacterota bacterium]
MISAIKQLTRQTAVYGAGTVLTRLVTFLLLPLFTHVLTPQEYGLVTLVYVFLGFMNIVYHYGLDSAFMRYASDTRDPDERRRFFSSALWLSLGSSALLSLLIIAGAEFLAGALLGNPIYTHLFTLAAGILFLDALSHVPFALLRLRDKAGLFVVIKFINVIATLGLNIYLVAILKRGITGIFASALIASVVTAVLVLGVSLPLIRLTFSREMARKLLRFGLPFVPAGLASIAMEMIDRYLLALLKDTATVGIYTAGYKLGIFMLLLTAAFHYAWQPFFLRLGKKEESRPVFARVFTYFVFAALLVWVTISNFVHEVIHIRLFGYSLIGPDFYEAESIVPIILMAYVFQGVYLNFLPGIYFEKKTHMIPLITGAGALVNAGLNLLLIPPYGMMGAALATVAAYVTMAVAAFVASRPLFSVPYEWSRVVRIVISLVVAVSVVIAFGQDALVKLAGVVVYVLLAWVLKGVPLKETRPLA